jgi:hypothetical protein
MISGFALFPGGTAGAGLLLLRFSVAVALLLLSASAFDAGTWAQIFAILGAAGLCVGLRTRAVATLCLAVPTYVLATGAGFSPIMAVNVMDALALVLTGPGACSVDAVLYGRRTVTLPDRDTIV